DKLSAWAEGAIGPLADHHDADGSVRKLGRALGDAGWLKTVVPASHGGTHDALDVRSLCVAREILGWHDGLADFSFAMQGLGGYPITAVGSDALRSKYLPPVAAGTHIAACALSEPRSGSDVANIDMTAKPDGANHVRLDGEKTWISNGGIADHYVVFARSGE